MNTRRKILMIVENSYPQDSRVRNEATLLADAGYEVTVICFRKGNQPRAEVLNGVRAIRLPRIELFQKTDRPNSSAIGRLYRSLLSAIGYAFEYAYFTSACFAATVYAFTKYGFDAIHAHNPPDTIFLIAAPFKLLGKKFVFDHHDLCPELYKSRFGKGECLATRVLAFTEWCSLKLADITIATNESYKSIQLERGRTDPDKVIVVRNGPAEGRMTPPQPSRRLRAMGKTILVYVGCLNPQDGVDYLLRALHHLRRDLRREDFHCVIIGSGDSLRDLRNLSRELNIDDCVELTGYVSEADLQSMLSAADICVDPDPSSPLNDVSTWIKIMEYMAYSKPIVTFDLKETHFSAQDSAVYVQPNDERAFAAAIATLMDDPTRRADMGAFARKRVVESLQWRVVGRNLLAAYDLILPLGVAEPAPVLDEEAAVEVPAK